MIELMKGRYVSQWWFMCGDNSPFDVLITMYRDQGTTAWQVVWRFRFYDGTNRGPFDDEDVKKWYRASVEGDEQSILHQTSEHVRAFAKSVANETKLEIHAVPLRTDDPNAILERLSSEPWMHVKRVEPDKEGDKPCESG